MKASKKSPIRIAGSILFYGILILALVSAFLFAFSTDEKKSIFGYRFYEVLSGSMRPTIDVGELVIIKMSDPGTVEVGDVVTKSINEDGSLTLTHRVIEKYDDAETGKTMLITQGDNNMSADEPIPADEVIGIMETHIPVLGYVVGFLKENVIFVVVLLIAVMILIAALRIIFGKKPQKASPEMMEERAQHLMKQARDLRDEAQDLHRRAQELRKQQDRSMQVDQGTAPENASSPRVGTARTTGRPAHRGAPPTPTRQRLDVAKPAHIRTDPPSRNGAREKGERGSWPVVPVE